MAEHYREIPRESEWEAQERKRKLEEERIRRAQEARRVVGQVPEPVVLVSSVPDWEGDRSPRIVRVERVYDDGSIRFVEGEDAEIFEETIENYSWRASAGDRISELDWQDGRAKVEFKRPEPPPPET